MAEGTSIVCLRLKDGERLRHSGRQTYRRHQIFINGVMIREMIEDSPRDNYLTGDSYTKELGQYIDLLHKALKFQIFYVAEK